MIPMIAGILNFAGPDMMIVLVIVFLLFGAKKLPELARGMGRAVKEFSAARDEIERGLGQSDADEVAQQRFLSFDLPIICDIYPGAVLLKCPDTTFIKIAPCH